MTAFVAPFAGAWIEIKKRKPKTIKRNVAPFAGAWIEIWIKFYYQTSQWRRTLRGCVD